jgi:hypothetical protein
MIAALWYSTVFTDIRKMVDISFAVLPLAISFNISDWRGLRPFPETPEADALEEENFRRSIDGEI